MWTLKICIIGLSMLCDTTTYSSYVTETQCIQAANDVLMSDMNYIASCEKP
jgi:hypothetical protein